VKRGSIAATVVIGVLLVAPWPGAGTSRQPRQPSIPPDATPVTASPTVAPAVENVADERDIVATARRLDVPSRSKVRRVTTRTAPTTRPVPRAPVATRAPVSAPAPTRVPAPRPTAPAATRSPASSAGVLIPVM
jgi:hypothetical protein